MSEALPCEYENNEFLVTAQWKDKEPFVTSLHWFDDSGWCVEEWHSFWKEINPDLKVLAWREMPPVYSPE